MKPALLSASSRLQQLLRARGMTLSCAESCTGGMISSAITAVPGSSVCFVAGFVVYAASAKRNILGISASMLRRHGLVSAETAKEMARKSRLLAATDYAVATTGNLGPDVLEGKARGLVYIAVSSAKRTVVEERRFRGLRETVREKTVSAALRLAAQEALRYA